jgi:hypothetical protein
MAIVSTGTSTSRAFDGRIATAHNNFRETSNVSTGLSK